MTIAYLSLGSNLGNRLEYLTAAARGLEEAHTRILRSSSVYETAPQGKVDQPAFLNLVLELETNLGAVELLRRCLDVERSLGRIRTERWGPRTVDIDILFFGDKIISQNELQVPHPRMTERAFVLVPLLELDPTIPGPGGRPLSEKLAGLVDQGVSSFLPADPFMMLVRGVK